VVPFISGYQTFWLGLGVVAIELLLALVVTSLLRTRIGRRAWRTVHWACYACWPIAVIHGLGIGGHDTRT
jgi:methionine sulfoxide reductase heme-binding subunit